MDFAVACPDLKKMFKGDNCNHADVVFFHEKYFFILFHYFLFFFMCKEWAYYAMAKSLK